MIAPLTTPRNVDCRKCRQDIPTDTPHYGISYRGRYGWATSHVCRCCAAKFVREVFSEKTRRRIGAGIEAVQADHGKECPLCRAC